MTDLKQQIDQILRFYGEAVDSQGYEVDELETAQTQLLALYKKLCEEVISVDEVESSNLDGDAGYWEKHGRNQLRTQQRNNLNKLGDIDDNTR